MRRLKRILRHLLADRWTVRRRFSQATLQAIEQAIRHTETGHQGQIRFAVEASLELPALLRGQSARERAVEVFSQLGVWDTERNNGVLIYLLLADRDVEIVADRGIHHQAGDVVWQGICHAMEQAFGRGDFRQGALSGIEAVGQQLALYYPRQGEMTANELPDSPVML